MFNTLQEERSRFVKETSQNSTYAPSNYRNNKISTQNDAYFIADKYQIHASQLVSCIATPAKDTAILKNHIDHEFSRLIAAGNPNPILMGAIPFDTQQNSSLSFYTESTKSCLDDLFDSKPQEFNVHQVKSSVSEQDFKELVEHALDTIEKTALSKVVLSRMLQLEIDSAPNVASLVKILVEKTRKLIPLRCRYRILKQSSG